MLKSTAVSIKSQHQTAIHVVGFFLVAFIVCAFPIAARADILVDTPPCCAPYYQGYQQAWEYYRSGTGYHEDRNYHQNYGPNGYHPGYGEEGYGYHRSGLGDYQISEAYGRNEFWGDGYQDHRGFGDYSH